MSDLISRDAALDSIDPDRILPDWMVEYVKTQLRNLPTLKAPSRKRAGPHDPDKERIYG